MNIEEEQSESKVHAISREMLDSWKKSIGRSPGTR
jgi:hypothetical protein